MTVSSTTSRVSYAGNGSTVTFTVPYYFLSSSDLVVIKTSSTGTQTTLVLSTDYTVSGAGSPSGGSITCTTAPASGETLVILRDPAATQLTDYQANDPFPAETHERALDKLTMIAQRVKDLVSRAFTLSDGDVSGASTQLPIPTANNVIGWNATATGLQNVTPQTLATIVSTGTTYADTFTGNGTQAVWVLSANPGGLANLNVSIGGVTQLPGIDYTWTSGTTLITTSAVPNGVKMLVRYAQALPQSYGDAATTYFLQAGSGAVSRSAQSKLRDTVSVKDFGALGDGVADDTAAIQNAINYCQDNNQTLEFQTGGLYKITGTLTFKHGRSSTDTQKYNVRVNGNNAIIYPSGTATAIDIVPRCTFADRATGRGEADIDISNLWIDGFFAPGTAKALNVGRAGFQCSNFEVSSILGLTVNGFNAGNTVVQFIECRHINITNMAIRAGSCAIAANTASTFCGDMVFMDCQFTGTASSRPLNINTGAASAEVRGITFSACDIYGTGTIISSTGAGSLVGDIWFENGCQFDGPGSPAGEIALTINASGTAKLSQIHVIQTYFVSYTGAVIYANTGASATMVQLNIQGGGINTITCSGSSGNAAIFCLSCESVSIRDVEFDAISATAGQLINIDGCTNVLIHNNKATNSSGINYGVTIGNASNNYSICNNVINVTTGAINDYTTGTPNRQSANNLVI